MVKHVTAGGIVLALTMGFGTREARPRNDWLEAKGRDPVDYIAATLGEHPIVILGEGHWVRHDVELLAELVRKQGGTAFEVLASELYPASEQEHLDELLGAPVWDRALGISILRKAAWPYEEYLEILEAAWAVNRAGRKLRVVGVSAGANWRETLLPQGQTYDTFMARRILEAAPDDSVRIIAHMGFHHAFTRYEQPDSWQGERVLRFMERTGNLLWRERGERVFMIALHPPFLCPDGDRLVLCSPLAGAIDCAASPTSRSVGFDVASSPFADLPIEAHYARGYRDLVLADLADGWVWQRTPDRYQAVRLIPFNDYAPGPAELAQALAANPFDDEGDYDRESLRELWLETEKQMRDYPAWRRWHDAGAWRAACSESP